jgi:hypothetical protein
MTIPSTPQHDVMVLDCGDLVQFFGILQIPPEHGSIRTSLLQTGSGSAPSFSAESNATQQI